MKKPDLARRLARQSNVSPAAAADEIDRVVHKILKSLRKGQPAVLPGLGIFTPGAPVSFRFDPPKPPSGKP
jgi:nucleoid DNA-binding protein